MLAAALLIALSAGVRPQDATVQDPPQDAAQDAAPVEADPPRTQAELEQMLAPLALYPDDLLAQILMASTYPLEVVEADRWVKGRSDLRDEQTAAELAAQRWDASVKSLANVPEVLAMLSENLDWTRQLGDAFLAQQDDVMQAVQTLRRRARDAGQLASDAKREVVEVGPELEIHDVQPQYICVPVYDPIVVYGPWPWPAWPPYAFCPPGWSFGFFIGCPVFHPWGFAWGHCNWHAHHIEIDVHQHAGFNPHVQTLEPRVASSLVNGKGRWTHAPEHRAGVPYRDLGTARRFGGLSVRQAEEARRPYRGRIERSSPAPAPAPAPAPTPAAPAPPRSPPSRPAPSRPAPQRPRESVPRPAPRPPASEPSRPNPDPPRAPPARSVPRANPLDGAQRGAGPTQRESERGRASRGGAPARPLAPPAPPPRPR
jgi:hypothetical protein